MSFDINVNVNFGPETLRAIQGLLSGAIAHPATSAVAAVFAESPVAATPAPAAPAAEAPRRGRPRKTEQAAAPVEPAPVVEAPAAAPAEPAPAPKTEAPQAEAAAETELRNQLREALRAIGEKLPKEGKRAILEKHGATSISSMPAANLAACLADLQAAAK